MFSRRVFCFAGAGLGLAGVPAAWAAPLPKPAGTPILIISGRMATIPIIALTANAFKDDIDACFAAGMNRFVSKPVRRDVLLNAMLAELARDMPSLKADDLATDDLLDDFPLESSTLAPSTLAPKAGRAVDPPALDAGAFDELIDMIGEEGVMEMVAIFETETRRRLRRLREGGQDKDALCREMHTLKGAAGTVAAPHLSILGRAFEDAANEDIPPTGEDIQTIEDALDTFLKAVHARHLNRAAA